MAWKANFLLDKSWNLLYVVVPCEPNDILWVGLRMVFPHSECGHIVLPSLGKISEI